MRSARLGVTLFLLVLLSLVAVDVGAQALEIKVNFQDAATVPPTGYLRDSGEAYGPRSAADQGGGTYSYGWVQPGTSTPATAMTDLGRNRATSQADLRLDTLMHMDHPSNGEPGSWQIAVANGLYEVTVSVGDAAAQGSDPDDFQRINVEGINFIDNFQSTGGDGASTRHTSATGTVSVTDGILTVDWSGGGINTKINYIDIISVGDTLFFEPDSFTLSVPEDQTSSGQVLLKSSNGATGYAINLNGPPSWLTNVSGTLSSVDEAGIAIDVGIDAMGLTIGQYTHTVTATAAGYTSADLDVILNVISSQPQVLGMSPADGATNVSVNTSVSSTQLSLPNSPAFQGVDPATLTNDSFYMYPQGAVDPLAARVAATLNTTGGFDAITLTPNQPLQPNTTYVVVVTADLQDGSGASYLPFTSSFTTGSGGSATIDDVAFEQVPSGGNGGLYGSLNIGPDGRLYASFVAGSSGIRHWAINGDGTLTDETNVNPGGIFNGKAIVGLVFDPQSTPEQPIMWLSVSDGNLSSATNFTGQIVKMSDSDASPTGYNWQTQIYVDRLPRSLRDHLSNSLVFGPNDERALYMPQGSLSAMGHADGAWGNRDESLLSAAILRFDLNLLETYVSTNGGPLDVYTGPYGFGDPALPYNPQAPGAPVKIFATGVRNAYDLVWHSNLQLYVPTNGSAGGGVSPGYPTDEVPFACQNRIDDALNGDYTGPTVPSLGHKTQRDYLFRIPLSAGGFYGHPNPTRCEWVLNGGNPTSGADPGEPIGGSDYAVGIQPDRNYRGFAFDFENNKSPNGVIEYQSSVFNGALQGAILVVRYSQNDDIIVLFPDGPNGDVATSYAGSQIPGFSGFNNPLELVENPVNGYIYVVEYGSMELTLLRPIVSNEPDIAVSDEQFIFDQVVNAGGTNQTITVQNFGGADLSMTASITGADASEFSIDTTSALIPPSGSQLITITFDPSSEGPKVASLTISSNDTVTPQVDVELRGLGKDGLGGSNEPSLQYILDTFNIPVDVGDDDPASNVINSDTSASNLNSLFGDEIDVQLFERAVDAPVDIELLAVFGPTNNDPIVELGYYFEGSSASPTSILSVDNTPEANGQRLLPPIATGGTSFDPGTQPFAFYSEWPFFSNRQIFQQDSLNTWDSTIPHKVRIYAMPGETNAYIVATEETTSGHDYQDIVFIARNVTPATPDTGDSGDIRPDSLDWEWLPGADQAGDDHFNTHLTFNSILSTVDNPVYHDSAVLRLHNDSATEPLYLTDFSFSGADANNFDLPNGEDSGGPLTVAANDYYDLTVDFTATSGHRVHTAQLNIGSSDPDTPSLAIGLGAYWQPQEEGGNEPDVAEIIRAFGFNTQIVGPGQQLNNQGRIEAIGEEVLTRFWQRANTSLPVYVRQLAAFHTCCNNTATVGVATNPSEDGSNGSQTSVFTHEGEDAQSFLPRLNNQQVPAQGTITPPNALFAFRVDGEWSDWVRSQYLNNDSADICSTNSDPSDDDQCGHHVRFWPARDAVGDLIPNAYFMVMDYSGINYDFNDNVYYITNIQPVSADFDLAIDSVTESADPVGIGDEVTYEVIVSNDSLINSTPATFTVDVTGAGSLSNLYLGTTPPDTGGGTGPTVVARYNAGGPTVSATDSGLDWLSDAGISSGGLGNNLPGDPYDNSALLAGPELLYDTERSGSTDIESFGFAIPLANGEYEVRLHFAEIWFTGQPSRGNLGGARAFDVQLEGNTVLSGYSPATAAGGPLTTVVETFSVTLSDGTLNIDMIDTLTNRPSIAAIEIIGDPVVINPCSSNTCDLGNITAGGTQLVTVVASADAMGDIDMSASVDATDETNTANNSASETTAVFDPSALPGTVTIIKEATPEGPTVFTFSTSIPGSESFELSDSGGAVSGEAIQVNFQNEAAPLPTGYLKDFGQPYGQRNGADQGSGTYSYGWVLESDIVAGTMPATPVDLSVVGNPPGNGRDREVLANQLQDTLMHMQYNDVQNGTNGVPTAGAWEIELTNGDYEVTVSLGDPDLVGTNDPENFDLNLEGIKVIDDFVPSGAEGASTQFVTVTSTITVADGRLTVDAIGGTNTKINYITITTLGPANEVTINNVAVGTYTVEEILPTDWSLDDVVCTESGDANTTVTNGIATLVVDSAEDITCTFQNSSDVTNQAPVIDTLVDQTVAIGDTPTYSFAIMDNDEDSLTIDVSGTPDVSSFVTITETENSPGIYTIQFAMSPQAGDEGSYDINVTADDGALTSTDNFTLTVNAQATGSITIVKDTQPDDAQEFTFTSDIPGGATFGLTDDGSTITGTPISFNFQLAGVPVPNGYLPDTGEAFGLQSDGYERGWIILADDTPVDASEAARDRDRVGIDQELDTFIHMQRGDCCTGGFEDEIYWEIGLPNGSYEVTVSVGDEPGSGGIYDSQHQVRLEGINVFATPYQANASNEYAQNTIIVDVTDGYLTMDPVGGFNTKVNYITIVPQAASNNAVVFSDVPVGEYTVLEDAIAGWSLDDVVCTGDTDTGSLLTTGGITIDLDANEDITCTFVNVPAGADTTPPVITLIGDAVINLTVGDTFVDPGATANDLVDGDISNDIVVGGDAVDTNTAGTYVITYDVQDAAGNDAVQVERTVNVNEALTDCGPYSTEACDQLVTTLPSAGICYAFDGTDGGLLDTNGVGIGFTSVAPNSAPLADQPAAAVASVPNYAPSLMEVAGGQLTITATQGIQWKANSGTNPTDSTNSLVNGLGTGFDLSQVVTIETTLVQPQFDGSSNAEQGGLWVWVSEDQYIKLVAINNTSAVGTGRIQLQVEDWTTPTTANPFEINSADIANLSNATVTLTLELDPVAGTATGSFSLDGATPVVVGTVGLNTVANDLITTELFDGILLPDGVTTTSFAGVFTSKRREAVATDVSFSFDEFCVTPEAPTTADVDVSFSLQGGHVDHSLLLTVTLTETGTGIIVAQESVTSTGDNNSGLFNLTGIEPGTYDLYVKGSNTLQEMMAVTLASGPNTADIGAIRVGDADDDNDVDLGDFVILSLAFNTSNSDTAYDARADFNADGAIALADFIPLSLNFTTQGTAIPSVP